MHGEVKECQVGTLVLSTYVLIRRDIMRFLEQYIIRAVDGGGRNGERESDS